MSQSDLLAATELSVVVAQGLAQAAGAAPLGLPAAGTVGRDATAPRADLARLIDHTLLKATATRDELLALCDEARRFGFATVCVNPSRVAFCAARLAGSGVGVCTVVGFPLGATTSAAKAAEAAEAVQNGATEVDMVLAIAQLQEGDFAYVRDDIRAVVKACGSVPVKVILETGYLSREQKVVACLLAVEAGAAFVKTSTGFGQGGATANDIALMRAVVGDACQVKASGGVRTAADADAMVAAGANRIGASASVAIVGGGQASGGGY